MSVHSAFTLFKKTTEHSMESCDIAIHRLDVMVRHKRLLPFTEKGPLRFLPCFRFLQLQPPPRSKARSGRERPTANAFQSGSFQSWMIRADGSFENCPFPSMLGLWGPPKWTWLWNKRRRPSSKWTWSTCSSVRQLGEGSFGSSVKEKRRRHVRPMS